MSPLKRTEIAGLLLIAGLLIMGGCGSTKNDSSTFNEDSHPADWLPAGHKSAAQADATVCQECHGDDYAGGISKVSCSQCHLGGYTDVHPTAWGTSIVAKHGAYVQSNGATACANAVCHGATLSGVALSGPACTTCHINGSPVDLTGCTSCHGNPPTGTVAPNRGGAHNTATGHFAAQVKLPDGCNTCHNGAGTGTSNHDNGTVDVSLLSVYSAKSGTVVYNADGTCSSVSCHGGQTTPPWLTGTIDVDNQCLACHAFGTTEYNSFISGQHYFHVITRNWQGECWRCHDVTKLADVHFVSLNTTTLDGQAYLTVQSWANYDKNAGTCDAICHPGIRNW